ncbi:copper amine oxidase N-terminal domain-containing protein [Brevibacillus brevis]|uniref:copper amine oxidase N-terminal domain-containing protein n=1 Tax=Brevibacillus brevis TaxID=1393 RepID=UPI00115A5C6D|nr:copper amine oxidase N-terminal domain-containing protein [Lysinibacillus sp. SDF0063]TQR35595.1 copper amine oxidase N-terminal domain-containing protein [Lysinibacillus sp. SDF0063]
MVKKDWKMICAITALTVSLAGTQVAWANTPPEQNVVVKLKVNTSSAKVNGVDTPVEEPYFSQGTTMVPLSLLTSAFGVTLQYDNETQLIELIYKTKSVKLKAGRKEVWINGKAVTLTASPETKNGKTMVPLTLITQGLGLTIAIDAKTNDVSILGTKQEDTPQKDSSLDSDVGKTMIGDSYYRWSMKYPTGMIQENQSFQGNYVLFKDAKEASYLLDIYIATNQPENLSGNGLLARLTDMTENSILSKEYIANDKQPYARLTTKSSDGSMNEERAYQKGSNIYYVTLSSMKEADFRNPVKYGTYKSLLDSFTLNFPTDEKSVKDLSTVEGNYRWYTNDDFALKVKVPAEWTPDYSNDMYFESDEGREWMQIKITSKEKDLTLDAWVKDHEKRNREEVNENYIKVNPEVGSSTIAGEAAKEQENSYLDGKTWFTQQNLFFVKGNYKYWISIVYMKDQPSEEVADLMRTIKQSLSIDTAKMNPSLGEIMDDDRIDKNKTVIIKDKDATFSLELPEYWQETRELDGGRSYQFNGGDFNFQIGQGNLNEVKDIFIKAIENNKTIKYTFKENKETTLAGNPAHKLLIQGTDGVTRFEKTLYFVQKGNKTFTMYWSLSEFARTKTMEERIQKVVDSLKFTK